jgi:hypothetical protein
MDMIGTHLHFLDGDVILLRNIGKEHIPTDLVVA